MKWFVIVVIVLASSACGPSTAEIRTAKSARYAADPSALFDIALQVTQRDYKIDEVDAPNVRFSTTPQIYSPEGGRQSPGAGGFVNMSDRSVMLALIVEIRPTDAGHVIAVTPRTFQMISGSPKPRELAPDDPNLPGWVHGRVDALTVAIHEAAKQHAIR